MNTTRRPKPVLAAVRDVPEGDQILRLASRHAAAQNTHLVVCHVRERDGDELTQDELEIRMHVITGRTEVDCIVVSAVGTPAIEIARVAREHDASLVVIGDGDRHDTTFEHILGLGIPVFVARVGPLSHCILVAADPAEPPVLDAARRESELFDGHMVASDPDHDTIVRAAFEHDAELVVVGRDARSVVSDVPCSVLAVPLAR